MTAKVRLWPAMAFLAGVTLASGAISGDLSQGASTSQPEPSGLGTGLESNESPLQKDAPESVIKPVDDEATPEDASGDGEAAAIAASDTVAASSSSPGSAPGSFAQAALVNPEDFGTGAFRREIKIEVPPFRGLEPSISLVYQSNLPLQYSGNGAGWLGIGWQLRGIPVIERGRRGGGSPSFDSNDVFLLSGEELIACTAGVVSPSCSAGGTHTSRVEDYRKVTYSSGTNYWSVFAKDGTKYEFRPTSETSPVSPSDPIAVQLANQYRWLLRKVTDTHGNEVVFTYVCAVPADPSYCKADTITYGGAQVKFYWETRPDPFSYASGLSSIDVVDRLKTIDVQFAAARVRTYSLAYNIAEISGLSRLASVQQFPSDATVAANGTVTAGATAPLPATTFSYQGEANTFATDVDLKEVVALGDFDGDGKTDRVVHRPSSVGVTEAYIIYFSSGGTKTINVNTGETYSGFGVGDFDGDGKDDFVPKYENLQPPGQSYVASLFAPNFSKKSISYPNVSSCCENRVGDFNGDGRADLFTLGAGSVLLGNANQTFTTFSTPVPGGFTPSPGGDHVYLDANGDGKSDFFWTYPPDSEGMLLLSTGVGWTRYDFTNFDFWGLDIYAVDANGDGRQDVASCGQLRLSTGAEFPTPVTLPPHDVGCAFGDFNGDGRTDLAAKDNSGTKICYYTGSGFALAGAAPVIGAPKTTADFNGDGRADLVSKSTSTENYSKRESTGAWPNLVTSTKAVLGGTTSLVYTPSSTWNLTAGTLMPFVIPAVTSVTENDGRGTSGTSTFTYSAGKWSPVERRFLGFAGLNAVRPCNTGESQCPTLDIAFSQDLAAVGRPTVVTAKTGSGTILRVKTESYTANNATPPFTALNTSSVDEDRDGGITRQRRTDRTFDAYGRFESYLSSGMSALQATSGLPLLRAIPTHRFTSSTNRPSRQSIPATTSRVR